MATPSDVAIIGMAGTFAGAPDISTYWSNILGKVSAIREAPADWIGDEASFNPACVPDDMQIYTKDGGFLGDLARFDPRPFGTMPVALGGAEPDQFLALKAAVSALADAGYAEKDFNRERTGIILGHGIHANRANVNGIQQGLVVAQTVGLLRSAFPELTGERCNAIEAMLRAKLPILNVDTIPGLVPNMMTGRIANRLDLMGPNYIIDAACASSLLAIESAVTELRSGHADLMLAGGVNTTTSPLVYMVFCKIGALSRTSKIRPFDKSADGTLLGEGLGVVVLKRLADALRDGDRIYAVIKGIGSASDGRAMGLMAPRLEGEILAMQRAYANSGIDPATIELVETHGTGIPLGDETEIRALTAVLGERKGLLPHIAIGSVKSMIGHCIPAAGMASVIKMALALDQKLLPPTLADEVNPSLMLEKTPFFLNTEALPWVHRRSAPRRAAIDAFGFGGINTHMILEEAPRSADTPTAAFGLRSPHAAELFLLAGDTRGELVAATRELIARTEAHEVSPRSLACERFGQLGSGAHRLAVVASDLASLRSKLRGVIDRLGNPEVHRIRSRQGVFFTDLPMNGKLAFLFPGENSQYANMLLDLATSVPLVRDFFDRLEGLFPGQRDVQHRLLLYPPSLGLSETERRELEQRLSQVDSGSETVFYADVALFALLRALGIHPSFIAGHSTGENAALVASGLLHATADQVDDYVRSMNDIFNRIASDGAIPSGTLLTVGAIARQEIDALLKRNPDIHLTMDNCRNQMILFGPPSLMRDVSAELTAKGAVCSVLPLSWAYHTPYVAPMADAFARLIRDEHLGAATAQMYSCASAEPFPETPQGIRALLRDQYVSCVRFSDTIDRLYQDGARIFVEVGPSAVLTGFVDDILRDRPHLALASNSRRGSSLEHVLTLLAQLFIHQVPCNLAPLYAAAPVATVDTDTQPPLTSVMPFIQLERDEADRLRSILSEAMPTRAAPDASPDAVASDWQERALSDHFLLMNEFMSGQERVGHNSIRSSDIGSSACVSSWNGDIVLPFPVAIEFVRAESTACQEFVSAIAPMLAESDLDYFDDVIRVQPARRHREWCIGRLAARRAIAAWLTAVQAADVTAEPRIEYDAEGQPVLIDPLHGQRLFLSVSHKDDVAVAAVSDRPVGIDLELCSALQDPTGVLEVAFSPTEDALLRSIGDCDAQLVATAWSAKEAAGKAVGQKLLGREQLFTLTRLDQVSCRVSIQHDGSMIDVIYAVDGDFICSLASPTSVPANHHATLG